MSFMHMRFGEAGRSMNNLSSHGEDLGQAWTDAKSKIAGNEGGIGNDILGMAFRGVYMQASTEVRTAADQVPGAIVRDAALGKVGVHAYESTETTNEALMKE